MPDPTIAALAMAIAFASLTASAIAAYISWRNAEKQGALTEKIKGHEIAYEQKRFFVALWDKMVDVAQIHPDDQGTYNEAEIYYALNTLELVAICWENELVDKRMFFLVFGECFRTRVEEIKSIAKPLPHLRETGPELLHDRQIILNVFAKVTSMSAEVVK